VSGRFGREGELYLREGYGERRGWVIDGSRRRGGEAGRERGREREDKVRWRRDEERKRWKE
jgi:hypothetical protein